MKYKITLRRVTCHEHHVTVDADSPSEAFSLAKDNAPEDESEWSFVYSYTDVDEVFNVLSSTAR